MEIPEVPLTPGRLWPMVLDRTQAALATGALAPIETEQEAIDDAGVRFVVRRVSSLARKAAQRPPPDSPASRISTRSNTFPFERELLVAEVSDTHVALLNKFPVIPHHVLLVTRQYVPQEALLDAADFDAMVISLREHDFLGFYNGGVEAGASQPHKHLQLAPLPLADDCAIPMVTVLGRAPRTKGVCRVPGLSFRHAFLWRDSARLAGEDARSDYFALLAAAGIEKIDRDGLPHQSAPYNLLMTRDWMLVVARSCECFERISINALGYAGSIFVKTQAERDRVRRAGPMAVLAAVAAR